MIEKKSSKLRQKRFKPVLFSVEERSRVCAAFFSELEPFLRDWRAQLIQDVEIVAAYWTLALKHLRPRDYKVGRTPWAHEWRPPDALAEKVPTHPATSYLQEISTYRYRSSPLGAHRLIQKWLSGQAQVLVLERIPDPYEILSWQCEGKRVVSLITDPAGFVKDHEGRDPVSFLLHDLVHADQFFSTYYAELQAFYRLAKSAFESGKLDEVIENSESREAFEYLIGDMNSHPEHMKSYFGHILSEANKS